MSTPASLGAVYDRGYRPYEGPRGDRRAAGFALYRASLRRAIGLRRPWRQKIMPALLLAIATVPALVEVGIGYVTRDSPLTHFSVITYRGYVGVSSALILFVALVAPDIVCPDRRQRVLSLIFARPITGREYALAKVGAIFTCVFAFSFLPQVVLFVGQALVDKGGSLTYVGKHANILWQVPLACAVLAIFYAMVGIAVASLTGRRIVAAATMLGLTLITSTVSSGLIEASHGGRFSRSGSPAALINLIQLPLQVRDLIFLGHIGTDSKLFGVTSGGVMAVALYVFIVVLSGGIILRRYRSVEI